jgi:hypothetical protein
MVAYLVAGIVAVAVVVLFFFDPSRYSIYPVCLFHKTTGLQCPGCGALRAMHQLLHGHIAAAFRLNALLVLSLPLAGWYAARQVAARLSHTRVAPIRQAWLWSALVVLVAFGVARNLPWAQFGWFGF